MQQVQKLHGRLIESLEQRAPERLNNDGIPREFELIFYKEALTSTSTAKYLDGSTVSNDLLLKVYRPYSSAGHNIHCVRPILDDHIHVLFFFESKDAAEEAYVELVEKHPLVYSRGINA